MPTLPLAGYNTWGEVNSTTVALTEWEVNPEVDDLEGTSTESGGFYVPFPGVVKAEITITGYFDAWLNPYAAPVNLTPGTSVSLLLGVSQTNTGVAWDFTSAMVKSAQTKASVKDKVLFTARLIGSGTFTYPEGDVL